MLIMESNPKSAVLLQMQLHPNDSLWGRNYFTPQSPTRPHEARNSKRSRQRAVFL